MELISIDELLTPDSSRHWPLEEYAHIKNLTSPQKAQIHESLTRGH